MPPTLPPTPLTARGRRSRRRLPQWVTLGFLWLWPVAAWSAEAVQAAPAAPREWRQHLGRSLRLLSESTAEKPNTVRVLFYGQSITGQAWWRETAAYLARTYPHARLIMENRARSAHAADRLVRTAEADLYPFQPDLLIFHVYRTQPIDPDYEAILRRIRERTCADILLQNDHPWVTPSPTENTDPGTLEPGDGWPWVEYKLIPDFAHRYAACLADVYGGFKHYLTAHSLGASHLLNDGVHLNDLGNEVMAQTVQPYLAPPEPGFLWPGSGAVRSVKASTLTAARAPRRFAFAGNRLTASNPGPGRYRVKLDGQAPSGIPALRFFGPSSLYPQVNWPGLLSVGRGPTPLLDETWAATVTSVEPDGTFAFEVRGTVTGFDGTGTSGQTFGSHSGRVVIGPEDWNLKAAAAAARLPLTPGFTVTWPVLRQFSDTIESSPSPVTIGSGLANTWHELELEPDVSGPATAAVPDLTFQSYQPALGFAAPETPPLRAETADARVTLTWDDPGGRFRLVGADSLGAALWEVIDAPDPLPEGGARRQPVVADAPQRYFRLVPVPVTP